MHYDEDCWLPLPILHLHGSLDKLTSDPAPYSGVFDIRWEESGQIIYLINAHMTKGDVLVIKGPPTLAVA